jgi:hypothetical protein
VPGGKADVKIYGQRVRAFEAQYGYSWLTHHLVSPRWRKYNVLSATSEAPFPVVGVLSELFRRPSFLLVDEIKEGTYRGDARESWKRLSRWAIRRAKFNIVNDENRIALLADYAGLDPTDDVIVYPATYPSSPPPCNREEQRAIWGVPDGAIVLCVSGHFNETAGAEWIMKTVVRNPDVFLVLQPVLLPPIVNILLESSTARNRIYVESRRLGWREAWSTAAAADIGVAVYHNPAKQFQRMGTSSNRLCMFLAMGVPVMASRQDSFAFLEEYKCGVLCDDFDAFNDGVRRIRDHLEYMRRNCRNCTVDYIDAPGKYRTLKKRLGALLPESIETS